MMEDQEALHQQKGKVNKMNFIIEIANVYDYIKELEQKNKDLEMQLQNVRKSYSKLDKEIIQLELENQKLKKEE